MKTKKILQISSASSRSIIATEYDEDYIGIYEYQGHTSFLLHLLIPLMQDEYCEIVNDRKIKYKDREFILKALIAKSRDKETKMTFEFQGFNVVGGYSFVNDFFLPNLIKPKKDWRIYAEFSDEKF